MKIFFLTMVSLFTFGCMAEEFSDSGQVSVADAAGGDATKVEFETKAVRLQQADVASADQSADTTSVGAPIACTVSCDDGNACTDDTCDTKVGQCVYTSKGWDCWPCKTDLDCKLGMKTCQDGMIHKDGYDTCKPDKTCLIFHKVEACPDDGNTCTFEECSYNDDNDVICNSIPIKDCKP